MDGKSTCSAVFSGSFGVRTPMMMPKDSAAVPEGNTIPNASIKVHCDLHSGMHSSPTVIKAIGTFHGNRAKDRLHDAEHQLRHGQDKADFGIRHTAVVHDRAKQNTIICPDPAANAIDEGCRHCQSDDVHVLSTGVCL